MLLKSRFAAKNKCSGVGKGNEVFPSYSMIFFRASVVNCVFWDLIKRNSPTRTTTAHNKHHCANMVRNVIKLSQYFKITSIANKLVWKDLQVLHYPRKAKSYICYIYNLLRNMHEIILALETPCHSSCAK